MSAPDIKQPSMIYRRMSDFGVRADIKIGGVTSVKDPRTIQSRWLHLVTLAALLTTCTHTASVHAFSGGRGSGDRWNAENISQLPSEVRNAVMHLCGSSPSAEHNFATYFQDSRLIKLHFEHFRCDGHSSFCNQSGCLQQEYISTGGQYRLLRSFYGQGND
jgi:hypothetical protein